MYLSRHQLLRALHTLRSHPETPSHRDGNESQALSLTPKRKVLLYVFAHRSDSGLGSMSRFNHSSITPFTIQINFSLLSLNSQLLSAHIIPRNAYSLSTESTEIKCHSSQSSRTRTSCISANRAAIRCPWTPVKVSI